MNISFQEIQSAVKEIDREAQFIGNVSDNYLVASIFHPVVGGFYFSLGPVPEWADELTGLFVVANHMRSRVHTQSDFALLLTEKEPQFVYYSILEKVFKIQSSGSVSEHSIISQNAVIAENVEIGPYCVVKNDVSIGPGSIIGSHCVIESGTTIGAGTRLDVGCHVGAQGVAWVWDELGDKKVQQVQLGGVNIGANCFLGSGSTVVRGSLNETTEIGFGTLLAPGCKIGHGCNIGRLVHMANGVLLAGNVQVGEKAFIGSGAVIRPRVRVDAGTVVAAGAVVVKNTSRPGVLLVGVPAREREIEKEMHGVPRSREV